MSESRDLPDPNDRNEWVREIYGSPSWDDIPEEHVPTGAWYSNDLTPGRTMFNALWDKEYWVTAKGVKLKIKNMKPTHRFNTIRMLERHCRGIQLSCMMTDTRIHQLSTYMDTAPDGAYIAARNELDDLETSYERSPEEWILTTPLYIALADGLPKNIGPITWWENLKFRLMNPEYRRK